jgi:GTPase
VERCRVLLHLVDGTGEDAGKDYKIVRAELEAYGGGIEAKPEIVALSKADALDPDTLKKQLQKLKRACGQTPLALSAVSRQNMPEALGRLIAIIDAARADDIPATPTKGISIQPSKKQAPLDGDDDDFDNWEYAP